VRAAVRVPPSGAGRLASGAGRLALAAGLVLASGGCALWPWGGGEEEVLGDPRYGVEVVQEQSIADFYARAEAFYGRLASRRVNTYATYQDRVLREHFRSEREFADYYADLANALAEAWFERNRPVEVEVVELAIEEPGRARVVVHLVGKDGKPLRPGLTHLEREDRWLREDGRWWIVPAKL